MRKEWITTIKEKAGKDESFIIILIMQDKLAVRDVSLTDKYRTGGYK